MHAAVRVSSHLALLFVLAVPASAGRRMATTGAERHVLAITASDFAFIAPDSVPAGMVMIHLRNEGLMPHHAWLVRLDGRRTLRALERELIERGVLPRWAVDVGGPGAVAPGGESRIVLRLAPGRHVILSGERLADGTTAVMRGMYHEIEVMPAAGDAGAPAADATIEITARAIGMTGALPAGRQRVRVVNRSATSQEVRIYPLRAGQSERALMTWLVSESTIAPAEVAGGVIGLPRGTSATLDLALPRGRYVIVNRQPLLRGDAAPPRARTVSVR